MSFANQFAGHLSKFVSACRSKPQIHRFLVLGALSLTALAFPVMAQRGGGGSSGSKSGGSSGSSGSTGSGSSNMPGSGDPFFTPISPAGESPDAFNSVFSTAVITSTPETSGLISAEACNSWTESSVRSPTVSATRLKIPSKASSEYQKACGSYKDKKYHVAEEHVRKAIDIYPDYSSAWVLLGQTLDAQQKREDAEKACQKAVNVDPTYVAPYLCLAEFAADSNDWNEVSLMSDRALALDPAGNPYVLFYASDSELHQNKLKDAEDKAQAAIQLDPWHHLPQAHLLLAHIYAAKGDLSAEASQLKLYLKSSSNSPDAAQIRGDLAKVQAREAKAASGAGADESSQQKSDAPAVDSSPSKADSGPQPAAAEQRPTLKNPADTAAPADPPTH